jgi:hypothetical protein
VAVAEPRTTGCYTDDGGVARCRATGKRCLSHRQAAELVHGAKARGENVERYHCASCGSWHFGHRGGAIGKPRRRRGIGRAWQRAMRGL